MQTSTTPKLVLLALAAGAFVATAAWAQNVLRMEEITIEGEIQKPQASYILQRSGKIDLGVDVRAMRPTLARGFHDVLDREPDLFRTDRR